MSLFYRQPGLPCPESPPRLPTPGNQKEDDKEKPKPPDYMGGVFPYLCQFWSIMHEVALLYTRNGGSPAAPEHKTLRFVEYKLRELLAWSNGLPHRLSRGDQNPHYVQVLQYAPSRRLELIKSFNVCQHMVSCRYPRPIQARDSWPVAIQPFTDIHEPRELAAKSLRSFSQPTETTHCKL